MMMMMIAYYNDKHQLLHKSCARCVIETLDGENQKSNSKYFCSVEALVNIKPGSGYDQISVKWRRGLAWVASGQFLGEISNNEIGISHLAQYLLIRYNLAFLHSKYHFRTN